MRALSTAASGMQGQQLLVDVISNNIANINTTAFQRSRAEFQDLLYQNQKRAGAVSADTGTVIPAGIQIGLGVTTGAVYRIPEQGELIQTNNTTDIAIRGRGYFQVQLPDGTFGYTRAGAFSLDATGQIVNHKGYPITPGLTVPVDSTSLTINEVGQVLVKQPGQIELQVLGQLDIATFVNPAGLESAGDSLFLETPASGEAIVGVAGAEGVGSILQGWLETSNVNPVTEITALITAQRGYELNSKVIQAGDEILQNTNQAKR
jgi:flagellar basal-body rod protein FlgG